MGTTETLTPEELEQMSDITGMHYDDDYFNPDTENYPDVIAPNEDTYFFQTFLNSVTFEMYMGVPMYLELTSEQSSEEEPQQNIIFESVADRLLYRRNTAAIKARSAARRATLAQQQQQQGIEMSNAEEAARTTSRKQALVNTIRTETKKNMQFFKSVKKSFSIDETIRSKQQLQVARDDLKVFLNGYFSVLYPTNTSASAERNPLTDEVSVVALLNRPIPAEVKDMNDVNLIKQPPNERILINNGAPTTPNRVFCPVTSVLDGMIECDYNRNQSTPNATPENNGLEYGNMNFKITTTNENYYQGIVSSKEWTNFGTTDIPINYQVEINLPNLKIDKKNCSLTMWLKDINQHVTLRRALQNTLNYFTEFIDSQDIVVKRALLNNGTCFTNLLDYIKQTSKQPPLLNFETNIKCRFKGYITGTKNNAHNLNGIGVILSKLLIKGAGDLFQEINAVCKFGGYIDPQDSVRRDGISPLKPPILPWDESGNAVRAFSTIDRISAARAMLLWQSADPATRNISFRGVALVKPNATPRDPTKTIVVNIYNTPEQISVSGIKRSRSSSSNNESSSKRSRSSSSSNEPSSKRSKGGNKSTRKFHRRTKRVKTNKSKSRPKTKHRTKKRRIHRKKYTRRLSP